MKDEKQENEKNKREMNKMGQKVGTGEERCEFREMTKCNRTQLKKYNSSEKSAEVT